MFSDVRKTHRTFSAAFIAKMARRYKPSGWIDAQIRDTYEHRRRGDVTKLCRRLGWPDHAVRRRARELGLVRSNQRLRSWGDDELAALESSGHLSLESIRRRLAVRGYERSTDEIGAELRRRNYRDQDGCFSLEGVAGLCGVDRSTVRRWIRGKLLRARPAGARKPGEQGCDVWEITANDIREFVARNPLAVRLGRVDQVVFLGILLRS